MQWTREELLNNPDRIVFEEDAEFDDSFFASNVRINGVKDVHVSGNGYFDDSDERLYLKLKVSGTMRVPDAITDEEIEIPLDTESDEIYVFGKREDDSEREVLDDLVDTDEAVIQDILLEVPLQATDCKEDEYPSGDGWKVYSEEDYDKNHKKMDPRLAVLKNYRSDEKN